MKNLLTLRIMEHIISAKFDKIFYGVINSRVRVKISERRCKYRGIIRSGGACLVNIG
jgi:hypothetical protein